jgi:hypothetical protein
MSEIVFSGGTSGGGGTEPAGSSNDVEALSSRVGVARGELRRSWKFGGYRSSNITWKGSRSPMETAESREQFTAVCTVSESDYDILRLLWTERDSIIIIWVDRIPCITVTKPAVCQWYIWWPLDSLGRVPPLDVSGIFIPCRRWIVPKNTAILIKIEYVLSLLNNWIYFAERSDAPWFHWALRGIPIFKRLGWVQNSIRLETDIICRKGEYSDGLIQYSAKQLIKVNCERRESRILFGF